MVHALCKMLPKIGPVAAARFVSVVGMPHPDVSFERARLEFAQSCLDAMRERTEALASNDAVLAANEADAEAVRWQLQRRLASLDDDVAALCFGRIDEERGDRWYVGRRHIEDAEGAPVVVDWRAGVATPFYRATLADPFGLERRRRFVFTARELSDVFEEDFSDPDSLAGSGGVPDPLLAELGRARTGQMRDIVATIQAEQDAIIRAPIESCLVVQGGPGTGKTAVGLHRAAFLLYEHRVRLAREGVLVVGPNPVFLRYISQVLPSLGETSATQTTVDGLLSLRFRIAGTEPADIAAIKGDARMTDVIARGAADAIRPPADGVTLRFRTRELTISGDDVRGLIDDARRRDAPFSTQRDRFRQSLIRRAYDRYTGGDRDRARRERLRRRTPRRRAVAQGDRRVLAQREPGRARAIAPDPARAARTRGRRGADRRRAADAAAAARGGRSLDRRRPRAHRRSRVVREGRAASLRPRRRRRGAGPLADATAHARPARPSSLDDRARRSRAGDGTRVADVVGSDARRTSVGPRTRSRPS